MLALALVGGYEILNKFTKYNDWIYFLNAGLID